MDKHKPKVTPRRVLYGDRIKLSSWHFGTQNTQQKLNSVAEINAIAKRYAKQRDSKDLETLLVAFNNLFLKYTFLLTTGQIVPEGCSKKAISSETRRFLSLFKSAGTICNTDELVKIAERLPNAILWMNADDVYNELVIIFIELAQKFNPDLAIPGKEFGFTGFIQNRFGWAVKARLIQLGRNALNFQPLFIPENPDDELSDPDQDVIQAFAADTRNENIETWENLISNTNFEESFKLTPSFISIPPPPFNTLWTKKQRMIVVYKHFFEMSDSAIAVQMKLSGGSTEVKKELQKAFETFRATFPKNS